MGKLRRRQPAQRARTTADALRQTGPPHAAPSPAARSCQRTGADHHGRSPANGHVVPVPVVPPASFCTHPPEPFPTSPSGSPWGGGEVGNGGGRPPKGVFAGRRDNRVLWVAVLWPHVASGWGAAIVGGLCGCAGVPVAGDELRVRLCVRCRSSGDPFLCGSFRGQRAGGTGQGLAGSGWCG